MSRYVPLLGLLLLQACLLFPALGLLPVWTDEMFTATTVAHPLPEIVSILQKDVHPPLYFALLRGWNGWPLPWSGIARLRAFSALWALLATVLLWGWLPPPSRAPIATPLALALFVLSPCLLLYSRMARSYSMQLALVILAAGLLWKWTATRSTRFAVAATAALLALLWTHYLPGIALLAGFLVAGWRRLGVRRLALFAAAIAAGYLPWLVTLAGTLRKWGEASGFSSRYALTGNPWLEHVLKIGYGVVSLTIGESFLPWSLLLVPLLLVLALRGLREWRGPLPAAWAIAAAAGVGYLGVSRWVSYPFVPARLLWLLPCLCLAVGAGAARMRAPMLRGAVVLAILLSYISSDALYFARKDYLNLTYDAPLREIASEIDRQGNPRDLILLDVYNTDAAIVPLLPPRIPHILLDSDGVAAARRRVPAAATVWIVRNTHDVSPGQITTAVESGACAAL